MAPETLKETELGRATFCPIFCPTNNWLLCSESKHRHRRAVRRKWAAWPSWTLVQLPGQVGPSQAGFSLFLHRIWPTSHRLLTPWIKGSCWCDAGQGWFWVCSFSFLFSKVAESLVQRDGDFLIRDSLSSPGNFVLTCQWKNISQHFKINRTVVRLSEAYCRVQYQFELESFDSIPGLVRYHVGNRKPISKQSGAIIFQPINRTVPLRCLEEKYGVSPVRQRECSISEGKSEAAKRLSLNVCGVQSREHSLTRGNLLRYFLFPSTTTL